MKISDTELDAIAQAATAGDSLPPRTVLHALTSLTGGQTPEQCVSEAIGSVTGTTWRTVALTATHVVLVEATSPIRHWSYSDATEPGTLVAARAFPRHTLTQLEVVATTPIPEPKHSESDRRQWHTTWRLYFGAETVLLPAEILSEDLVAALRISESSPTS